MEDDPSTPCRNALGRKVFDVVREVFDLVGEELAVVLQFEAVVVGVIELTRKQNRSQALQECLPYRHRRIHRTRAQSGMEKVW